MKTRFKISPEKNSIKKLLQNNNFRNNQNYVFSEIKKLKINNNSILIDRLKVGISSIKHNKIEEYVIIKIIFILIFILLGFSFSMFGVIIFFIYGITINLIHIIISTSIIAYIFYKFRYIGTKQKKYIEIYENIDNIIIFKNM